VTGPMTEDRARDVGLLLAAIRTAIGVIALLAPSLARVWVGPPGASPGGKTLSRSLAAREVVLGGGALMAGSDPDRLRTWLSAAALCDAVDALGTAGTPRLPGWPRLFVTISSATAAVAGGAAALSLPAPGSTVERPLPDA
jgi:hypothetical protein